MAHRPMHPLSPTPTVAPAHGPTAEPRTSPAARALRHADALAAWVLLGWLGMRLGWSVASGVLPVVIWWGVRATCEATLRIPQTAGLAGLWLALLSLAAISTNAVSLQGSGLLLAVAGAWGVWSASLADPSSESCPPLPRLAMGLMMGSLWLYSQWCLGPGWTDAHAVALHLGMMTGLPLLVLGLERLVRQPALTLSPLLAHGLLVAGALLMAMASTTVGHVSGMVMLVLAGALSGQHPAASSPGAAALARCWIGPALLLGVGVAATTWGPTALGAAWALVALLALAVAARHVPFKRLRSLSTRHRWSDAS